MKPLKLTMQAFESYGEKTDIDFTEPDQNIFLITGDTGAGKTSIFDAIVFALYGEASSEQNKKSGKELQSQYADFKTEPFVELEFSERRGGEIEKYTVRRSPQHFSPLKRATKGKDSLKSRPGEVSLAMPDGSTLQKKDADEKLVEITGLTKEQFMQIAMIAQGEFMEMLRVDSNKKKEIFRKLFNTGVFEEIVEELDRRAKESSDKLKDVRNSVVSEVRKVKLPEGYEASSELEKIRAKVVTSDEFSITGAEEFNSCLSELCDELKSDITKAREKENECSETRDKKRDELKKAETLLAAFESLQKARNELDECEKRRPEINDLEKLVKSLEDAYEIKETGDRFRDVKENREKTSSRLGENKERYPEAEKKASDAEELSSRLGKEKETAINENSVIREKVERGTDILNKIEKEKKELEKNKKNLETAEKHKALTDTQIGEISDNTEKLEKRGEELSDIDVRLSKWEDRCRRGSEAADLLSDAVRKDEEVSEQKDLADKKALEYRKAAAEYEQARSIYESMNRKFLDEQAGVLARELKEGEPCPVCGSLSHPCPHVPAVTREGKAITREELDALKDRLDAWQTDQSEKSKLSGQASEALKQKNIAFNESLEKLETKIKDIAGSVPADFNIKSAGEFLENWQRNVETEGRKLKELKKEADTIQSRLSGYKESKERLQESLESISQEINNIRADVAASDGRLKSLNSQKTFETKEEAEKLLRESNEKTEAKNLEAKEARDAEKEAVREKEKLKALISQDKMNLEDLQKKYDDYKVLYEQILDEKKMSGEEWQELTDKYSRQDIKNFRETVNSFNQKVTEARTSEKNAYEITGDREKPDMETLRENSEDADKNLSEAKKAFDYLKGIYDSDKEISDEVNRLLKKAGENARKASLVSGIYRRLAGKVTGSRMDLETYVQRYYLRCILGSANRHFNEMTSGQYSLMMTDEDTAGAGKNRGLDLMVYSAVTGKEREVRTLSGGESFMAALSLALGMADQIMMSKGSVNLDMIFIDEGFGSLDDHSRQQAVRVLKEMAEDSRLIGIISHVTELKQEIDDQLVVKKDDKGSHVRWVTD